MSAPDPELVEALARRLFRAENPPQSLWDGRLIEQAGLSAADYCVIGSDERAAYLARAEKLLLDANTSR